jgi:murein DD-endopeptidase MepM/ murein hydrolase activator NlpD
MIFQTSKPISFTIGLALLLLTACSQPPNYAPVKTVNQAIEPNNGYYLRKRVPNNPLNNTDNAQKTAKGGLDGQQHKLAQNHKTAPVIKQKSQPQLSTNNSEIIHKNQSIIKTIPSVYQGESQATSKEANSDLAKKLPPKQQKAPKIDQQASDQSKKQPILSNTDKIALSKNTKKNALSVDKNLLISKNNKEKTSIISTDNKKVLKLNFQLPIKGKISKNFAQTDNKGIDITGKAGQAVQAAEAGKAVYCGQGLAGFGNLVIIKHNETYLSAYANNSKLYVKEGQRVEKGQTIGQVGSTGLKKAALHFEIRKNGIPINPLTLMPKH